MKRGTFFRSATDSFKELGVIYLTILSSSAVLFSWFEHKPILDSLWWACVTAMTVGYGDMYPVTLGGRAVAVVLMHIVPLVVIPMVIARLLDVVIENRNEFSHQEQEEMKGLLHEINNKLKKK